MASKGQLSSALRITNVNDFLAPTTSCILPMQGAAVPTAPAGSVLSPIIPTSSDHDKVAKVTVSDCLACSGCVTSADTVLLSSNNIELLAETMANKPASQLSLALLSHQSVASFAALFNTSLAITARKLCTFLKHELRFDFVVDPSFATRISQEETAKDFLQTFHTDPCNLPLITSICPGWLTYAEKTQDEQTILQRLCKVSSTQAIVASLARHLVKADQESTVWMLSVSPCHDRKLEAARPVFVDGKQPDCVVTTSELLDMMLERDFDFKGAAESHIAYTQSDDGVFGSRMGSTSDGYAAHVASRASTEILGLSADKVAELDFRSVSRSGDVKVATVSNEDGSMQLKFATAYGFRSLQTILRKIRTGHCDYHFIELMACPGGCTNGGGQISPTISSNSNSDIDSRPLAKQLLKRVNASFNEAPIPSPLYDTPVIRRMYDVALGGQHERRRRTDVCKNKTNIQIISRKMNEGISSIEW